MDDPKGHEAGYDAFITGVLFLHLVAYLGFDWKLFNEHSDYNTIKPFLNHIPLPHRKPLVINLMKRNPEAPKSIGSESTAQTPVPAAPSMNILQLIFWIIGKLIEFLFKNQQPQLMDQLKEPSVDEKPYRSGGNSQSRGNFRSQNQRGRKHNPKVAFKTGILSYDLTKVKLRKVPLDLDNLKPKPARASKKDKKKEH